MRRTVRFLIRLYPANWRARYGEEFEALLEDRPTRFSGLFDLLKGAIRMQLNMPSFPKLALLLSVAGLLTGLGISFLVTPRYISTAVMDYEVSPANSGVAGVNSAFREHIVASQQEVLSRTSLSFLIQDPRLDLYPEERARLPLEDVIQNMRSRDLKITALEGVSGGVEISFAYRDPRKAQQAVQVLITRFSESNLTRQRNAYTTANRPRSTDQVGRLEARIAVLEKRLGIASSDSEPGAETPVNFAGFTLEVIDPPSLPETPIYPNRASFLATGFGAGIALALVIAVFRRRPPAIPFPAELA